MIEIEGTTINRGEQIWFDDNGWGERSTPEELLWRSVLARAVLDSLGHTSLPANTMTRKRAIENAQQFFLEPHPSLQRICENAGIDSRLAHKTMVEVVTAFRESGEVPEMVAAKSNQGRPRIVREAA